MPEQIIDLATWPRSRHFQFFRSFERPHYATTVRLDATELMAARAQRGISPYRSCLYAIGAGLDATPELRLRFRQDVVVKHSAVAMSMTVLRPDESFGFGYLYWQQDRQAFDTAAQKEIETVRHASDLTPAQDRDDVAYLSCLPWLDLTGLDNALPHKNDCIPRIGWGKIMPEGSGHRLGMAIQVHHALVDGMHLGQFFTAVQTALDEI